MMELRTGLPEHYCVHKVVTTARYVSWCKLTRTTLSLLMDSYHS